jgi:sec-independent protein translocase protein TatC
MVVGSSTIAILILATVTFFLSDYIFDVIILVQPMLISLPIGFFVTCLINWVSPRYLCDRHAFIIQNTTNMEAKLIFDLDLYHCQIYSGFPFILWEVWKFISPALYEEKTRKTFIVSSSLLFFFRVLFGYFVIVPMSVNFFATFTVSTVVKISLVSTRTSEW